MKRIDDLHRRAADPGHPQHAWRSADEFEGKIGCDRLPNLKHGDPNPSRAFAQDDDVGRRLRPGGKVLRL